MVCKINSGGGQKGQEPEKIGTGGGGVWKAEEKMAELEGFLWLQELAEFFFTKLYNNKASPGSEAH